MFAQSVTSLRLLLKTDLARRVTLFNGTYSARVSNMPRDQNSLHPNGEHFPSSCCWWRLGCFGGVPRPPPRQSVPLHECTADPLCRSWTGWLSARWLRRTRGFCARGFQGRAFCRSRSGGIEWVDLRNCLSTCNQPPRTCCTSLRSSGDRRVLWHPLLNSLVHSSATQATAV